MIGLHREDEAFLRHVEELALEPAEQHVGALDEARHFIEQGFVGDRLEPLLRGGGIELPNDVCAAIGKARDHGAFVEQLRCVVIGVAQLDHRLRGFESMALRRAPGVQAQRAHGHHLGTVQRNQPVRRTNEVHARPSVGKLVLHHLRNRQLGERFVDGPLQAFGQRRALDHAVVEERLGLAVHLPLERRHGIRVGTDGSQFLQQRRRRLAIGSQAHAHRHQLLRRRLVGGGRCHACNVHRQPARRRKRSHLGRGSSQALRLEAVRQRSRKGLAQFLQGLGRQLFDEELDEQILGRHVAHLSHAAFFSIWATTSSAQDLGAIGKPSRARLSR